MTKKKNNENNNNNQVENTGNTENVEKKDGAGAGGGKNVVLKIDLHCEGCATKVTKRIRAFEGVRDVQIDGTTNKISVTGKIDPVKLKKKLEEKLHKKVEIISPVLKKDGKKDGGGDDGDGKSEKSKDSNESNNNKKSDGKKDKVIPVTTAVLKVPLHCEGCIQKIIRIISKTKGYHEMKIDKTKDLVTVTGAIEMKALVESLKKQLKRKNVEIFQNKKDEKKDKDNQKENNGGGGGKGKGGKGGGEAEGGEEWKTAANKMQVQFGYGPSFYDPYNVHAPQFFSDENPNACSIM